ncbi:hypothetical protein [uncultured Cytophaga sp.]|uniref:hypothetical protein n=1 Tax=uncultured Cytophaga sp. TaxID=160238 RepID=UPI002625F510|nr:hypothetical protein [uncultured Cytophaga sp.]
MKKTILIFLFLTSLYGSISFGQVPGYMGKRCILKANIHGMPITGFLFANEKPLDFNFKFSVGMDYVISRNISFGISAEQVNDIILLNKLSTTPIGQSYPAAPTTFKSAANFYGYNLGANMKFFLNRSSGALAPFGRYFVIEYLKNYVTVSDDGRYYASGNKQINTISTSTILIGMGSQKILFNRLVIDTNLKYGVNFYGLTRIKASDTRIDFDPVYAACTSKMFSDYLFTLSVGIGVLAF